MSSTGQDGGQDQQLVTHPVIIHRSLLHTDIHQYFTRNQTEFKMRGQYSVYTGEVLLNIITVACFEYN